MTISLRSVKQLMKRTMGPLEVRPQLSEEAVSALRDHIEIEVIKATKAAMENLEKENSIRAMHGLRLRKRLSPKDLRGGGNSES